MTEAEAVAIIGEKPTAEIEKDLKHKYRPGSYRAEAARIVLRVRARQAASPQLVGRPRAQKGERQRRAEVRHAQQSILAAEQQRTERQRRESAVRPSPETVAQWQREQAARDSWEQERDRQRVQSFEQQLQAQLAEIAQALTRQGEEIARRWPWEAERRRAQASIDELDRLIRAARGRIGPNHALMTSLDDPTGSRYRALQNEIRWDERVITALREMKRPFEEVLLRQAERAAGPVVRLSSPRPQQSAGETPRRAPARTLADAPAAHAPQSTDGAVPPSESSAQRASPPAEWVTITCEVCGKAFQCQAETLARRSRRGKPPPCCSTVCTERRAPLC